VGANREDSSYLNPADYIEERYLETNLRKFTYLSFLIIAGLVTLVIFKFSEAMLVFLKVPTQLRPLGDGSDLIFNHAAVAGVICGVLGLACFFVLAFSKKAVDFSDECVAELWKVTWPTQKETTASTVVVSVIVLVAALLFFLMDQVWSNLFSWIL
jgi:preprotein translocase subunit SecE